MREADRMKKKFDFENVWNTAYYIYTQIDKTQDARIQELLEYLEELVNSGTITAGDADTIFEDLVNTVNEWKER